jgi:hypothetical protein
MWKAMGYSGGFCSFSLGFTYSNPQIDTKVKSYQNSGESDRFQCSYLFGGCYILKSATHFTLHDVVDTHFPT